VSPAWQLARRYWIRPVSHDDNGTLHPQHYLLDDSSEAAVLDVLQIEVTTANRKPHQPENWLLGPAKWRRLRQLSGGPAIDLLRDQLTRGPVLLGNRLDRIEYQKLAADCPEVSLAIIEPHELRWRIKTWPERRTTRAVFSLRGNKYDLGITDPAWLARLRDLPDGEHPRVSAAVDPSARVFLTVSLSEPLDGYCFKLVAAVIVLL
jgi:hypothetical protein